MKRVFFAVGHFREKEGGKLGVLLSLPVWFAPTFLFKDATSVRSHNLITNLFEFGVVTTLAGIAMIVIVVELLRSFVTRAIAVHIGKVDLRNDIIIYARHWFRRLKRANFFVEERFGLRTTPTSSLPSLMTFRTHLMTQSDIALVVIREAPFDSIHSFVKISCTLTHRRRLLLLYSQISGNICMVFWFYLRRYRPVNVLTRAGRHVFFHAVQFVPKSLCFLTLLCTPSPFSVLPVKRLRWLL